MSYGISFTANMVGTKFNGIYCDPFVSEDDIPAGGIQISPKLSQYETQLRDFANGDLQQWISEYLALDHKAQFSARNKLEARISKRLAEIVRK